MIYTTAPPEPTAVHFMHREPTGHTSCDIIVLCRDDLYDRPTRTNRRSFHAQVTNRSYIMLYNCLVPRSPIRPPHQNQPPFISCTGRQRTGKIGRASCRERVEISVVAVSLKK